MSSWTVQDVNQESFDLEEVWEDEKWQSDVKQESFDSGYEEGFENLVHGWPASHPKIEWKQTLELRVGEHLAAEPLRPVKLNGLRVRIDVFIAYCIQVIIPTILVRRDLELDIAALQKLRTPGQAPASTPDSSPERGLFVYIADPIQDVAAQRPFESCLSRFGIKSWDPVSMVLIISVPSSTEARRQAPGYCKHLRAARLFLLSSPVPLPPSDAALLATPAPPPLCLIAYQPPSPLVPRRLPPVHQHSPPQGAALALFGSSSQALPDVDPVDDAAVIVPLLEPYEEPSEPSAGSEGTSADGNDPEGSAGGNEDWLEPNPGDWGDNENADDRRVTDDAEEVLPAGEVGATDADNDRSPLAMERARG
ncbi:hypothetical protein BDK51DRAFT_52993 [Blyttiomyces helicus]|uniref:Uncharacterized protein n=1 Tax=Blyttiomyces helicus TaxID=388810 RepID=A0A4V1IQD2_9FUNG|nr:hypothetical protein BDK51DRAFT_52993 [Blyttiomyces helicus]|eukprot:RKO86147.1 hypothetical protein BDK51DRAFT_52993 [Blyttiomyces helicus]